ncbi:MAG: lyase family protein [Microbacterium sp.]
MPSDPGSPAEPALDVGLLSPVTVGHDASVTDAAIIDALVTAEVALSRAWAATGIAPASASASVSEALGWSEDGCRGHGVDPAWLAEGSVEGGNPVVPLVAELKARVPADATIWVHRGATSQDILDSALMLVASRSGALVLAALRATERTLADFALVHRDHVAAARTLTQHAVPTTLGLRAAVWVRGVRRAMDRLEAAVDALPAQLGGAAGTLASFAEVAAAAAPERDQADAVEALVRAYAAELGLAVPEAPWHTTRWPVTELGDALVQALDALGKLAADVATAGRTEIAELAEGGGGGSSAMPQKRNPAASVLIRSAALRAPQLGATLHVAAALAVDERPDGAWHAEWPTLRELLRLALGASANAVRLVEGLTVDDEAVARNLALTDGLILSERLSIVLVPLLGKTRFDALIAEAGSGGDLAALLRLQPETAGSDIDGLLDPAQYLGLAGPLVDGVARRAEEKGE